jgi:putative oxidoreductase
MKFKEISSLTFVILLMLLFIYTSASKFLDYEKFVFQMRLSPLPLMKIAAPILGWAVPAIEILIAFILAVGFFYPPIQNKGLYASVALIPAFEIYIAAMLISGSHLPCTCGGIVSQMGWGQHLLFNAFFIIGGTMSIIYKSKHKVSEPTDNDFDKYKTLSRA